MFAHGARRGSHFRQQRSWRQVGAAADADQKGAGVVGGGDAAVGRVDVRQILAQTRIDSGKTQCFRAADSLAYTSLHVASRWSDIERMYGGPGLQPGVVSIAHRGADRHDFCHPACDDESGEFDQIQGFGRIAIAACKPVGHQIQYVHAPTMKALEADIFVQNL